MKYEKHIAQLIRVGYNDLALYFRNSVSSESCGLLPVGYIMAVLRTAQPLGDAVGAVREYISLRYITAVVFVFPQAALGYVVTSHEFNNLYIS
jgi:hypothetical protein